MNSTLEGIGEAELSMLNASQCSLSEENMLDTLFAVCDRYKTGHIPASHIVSYIRNTSGCAMENPHAIDELMRILDPDGCDVELNRDTCIEKISEWIRNIRHKSECESYDEPAFLQHLNRNVCYNLPHESIVAGSSKYYGGPRIASESDILLSSLEVDLPDLMSQLADLQHNNKRLVDGNTKLQSQLEISEEAVATHQTMIRDLDKKIHGLQQIVDRREETLQENEDLKASIAAMEEQMKKLDADLRQKERDLSLLESQLMTVEAEFQKKIVHLEAVLTEQQALQECVAEQKMQLDEALALKEMWEVKVIEKDNRLEELEVALINMNRRNEELMTEKCTLEAKVQIKQSVSPKLKNYYKYESISSDEEEPAVLENAVPNACSTPRLPSLRIELKDMIKEERHLPSPLCEKTTDSLFLDMSVDQASSFSLSQNGNTDSQKLIGKFAEKQSQLVETLTHYIIRRGETASSCKTCTDHCAEHNCPGTAETLSTSTCQREMGIHLDFYKTEFRVIMDARAAAEKKVKKLSKIVKRLKDENNQLRVAYDESLILRLPDFSADHNNTMDDQLVALKAQLEINKQYIDTVDKQKAVLEAQLVIVKDDIRHFQQTISLRETNIKTLKEKVQQLERTNAELSEKFHKADAHCEDLNKDIQRSQEELSNEQERAKQLEHAVSKCENDRFVALTEIWKLVQAQVEEDNIHNDNAITTAVSSQLNSESLQQQVSKEITDLKKKLYRTQAAFSALKKNSRSKGHNFKLQLVPSSKKFVENGHISSLVDALTIDFLDKCEWGWCNCASKSQTSHTDSLTQGHHAELYTRHERAVSCPSLASQNELASTSTQTDSIAVSSTNIPTSTSSSTSVVFQLDTNSNCILNAQLKRTDILNGCNTFDSTQDLYHTSQSIYRYTETSTDTDANSMDRQDNPSIYATSEGLKHNHNSSTELDNCSLDWLPQWPPSCTQSMATNMKKTLSLPMGFNHVSSNNCSADDIDQLTSLPRSRRSSFQAAIENGLRTPAENGFCELPQCSDTVPRVNTADETYNKMMSYSEECLSNTTCLSLSSMLIQPGDANTLTQTKTPWLPSQRSDDTVFDQAVHEASGAKNNGGGTEVKLLRSPRLKIEHLKTHIIEDTTTSPSTTSEQNNIQIDQAAGPVTCQQDVSMDTTGYHVNQCTLENGICTAVTATTASQVVKTTPLFPMLSASVSSKMRSPPATTTQSAAFEQLTKIRQENLARRRGQIQSVMMPELSEDAEMDTSAVNTTSNTTGQPTCQSATTVISRVTKTDTPITSDSKESICTSAGDDVNTMNNNSNKELNRISSDPVISKDDAPSLTRSVSDPATTSTSAFPSLPDDVLNKMGLSSTELKIKEKETSPEKCDDDPNDQEIENQFLSLALAFKTDKLTLDKRVEIHERSRDITEENIAKDLEELRVSITEGRMSKAIEVMVHYVEVLKRKYEKEHTDLEEAKRLLLDSNLSLRNGPVDIGNLDNMGISRRSLTNPAAAAVGRPKVTRRRNSVAVLPRMTGIGLPGLPGLSGASGLPGLPPAPTSPLTPIDMRNRFKTAISHTTSTIRRRSLEKSALNVMSTTHPNKDLDRMGSVESSTSQTEEGSTATSEEKEAKEEEAFQKGFEKGIRAQLSKDLGSLRRDQQNIHEVLDRLMDENQDMDDEEEDSNSQKNNHSFSFRRFIFHGLVPGVRKHHNELRLVVIGLLVISAMLTALFTFIPLSSAAVLKSTEMRYYGRPPS